MTHTLKAAQSSRGLRGSRLFAWLAVGLAAASLGLACSSSSPAKPQGDDAGGSDDATGSNDDSGQVSEASTDDGGGSDDAPAPMAIMCDAAIKFPASGAGSACGACITKNCMTELGVCHNDPNGCLCTTSIECLAKNANNYTLCADALSAIGAGDDGLTMLAACITSHCMAPCSPTD